MKNLCSSGLPRRRILIAEDDMVLAEILADVLQREGYSVETTASGDQALIKAHEMRFDLLIVDLHLPGQSGLLVSAKLSLYPHAPKIICITAQPRGSVDRWAGYAGVDAVLHKPFNMSQMFRTISQVLDSELAIAM